jgi:predicted DNA-binding transcriptional regulator YafY
MLQTSARLLRLLSLLQSRRDWTGPDLAGRLGVSTRTVRSDVERLRQLGYPVHATPGVAGGYRLGAGAALPPLLLEDEEAVAVAVGLRTAAAGGVAGIEETALRALAKLEPVLPARLRARVGALNAATDTVSPDGPRVSADVLGTLAAACRDRRRLRFDYRSFDGTASRRDVEPHRLVHVLRRWYLVGWDVERDDWRTFRVDRVEPREGTGPRFAPRPAPDGDFARHVQRGAGAAMWRYRARLLLHAPAAAVAARLPPAVEVEPAGADRCVLHAGSDSLAMLAVQVGLLEVDFEVLDPPELREHLAALARRYARAAGRVEP